MISATLFDSLSNIMTVITLRLEKSMEKGILARVGDLLKPFKKNVLINEWKWFTADILIALIYGVIVIGFIYQHWVPGKIFYIGGLVTLLGYVNQFTSVFHDVAWQYTQIIQYNTDVQTAVSIEKAFAAHHRADLQEELPENWNSLELSGLNFSHEEAFTENKLPHSLRKISIRLQKGKRIALIGESGSGKTTLMALMRGLYEPEAGYAMLVDGRTYSLGTLSQTVTLFPQEPEIFENTILYNLTLGLPFSTEDIQRVCDCAHFSDVVEQLPRGLDSNIQEKGVNLSGGQKQRLALARGILAAQESEVVLLDEPTSSVDPKTEAQIYENIFRAFAGKAMVSSLHRLHLLPHFDYIYVLENGSMVAEGKFDDLRQNSESFKSLWKHQEEIRKNTLA